MISSLAIALKPIPQLALFRGNPILSASRRASPLTVPFVNQTGNRFPLKHGVSVTLGGHFVGRPSLEYPSIVPNRPDQVPPADQTRAQASLNQPRNGPDLGWGEPCMLVTQRCVASPRTRRDFQIKRKRIFLVLLAAAVVDRPSQLFEQRVPWCRQQSPLDVIGTPCIPSREGPSHEFGRCPFSILTMSPDPSFKSR